MRIDQVDDLYPVDDGFDQDQAIAHVGGASAVTKHFDARQALLDEMEAIRKTGDMSQRSGEPERR